MRRLLLATAAVIVPLSGAAADTTTPGQGALTDSAGNVWTISTSGSIQENNQWVAGGGGTAALSIDNGVVYGEDAHGRGWFTLSSNGGYWSTSVAPPTTQPVAAPPEILTTPPVTTASAATTTTTTPCPASTTAVTGTFQTINGQVIGPDGKPFIARGIGVMNGGNMPSVSALNATFTGANFVRLAVYDSPAGSGHYPSGAELAPYVNALTASGRMVEIEDHTSSDGSNQGGARGQIYAGPRLTRQLAAYTDWSNTFKSNRLVIFGTTNEPPQYDTSALANWQWQIYSAIRATGNKTLVMLEPTGWSPDTANQGMPQGVFSQMHGTIWDWHIYGRISFNGSTDPNAIAQMMKTTIANLQAIKSGDGTMPIIWGEWGNSMDGVTMDVNAALTAAAVINSGYGSAAWAWDTSQFDGLINADGTVSSPFGQTVELFTNTSINLPTACQIQQQTTVSIAAAEQTAAEPADTTTSAAPASGTLTTDQTAAATEAVQQLTAGADAVIQQATAALNAIPGTTH